MTDTAVRTVGLGKMYRIGGQREAYRTLRDTLVQMAKRPLERLRHPGAATHHSEVLWALKDVDLEVRRGEAVGIIGRNGAGKSTLLKVLSHITEPTEGRVEIRGRVGSLLEVGTGFHSELTGRENIFLNGAILGMTRAEIRSRFDEIVEFAEISRFLDTPVKRYSSGMYVRLAFAVAAHLDPEILIVDEVLAVGDAAFQKKCLGKMSDVAGGGRTVLFVSHNLSAVRQLCERVVMLDGGLMKTDGKTDEILRIYMSTMSESTEAQEWTDRDSAPHGPYQWLRSVRIVQDGASTQRVDIEEPFSVEFDFVNDYDGEGLYCNLVILDDYGAIVLVASNNPLVARFEGESWFQKPHPRGAYRYSCTFPSRFLNVRRYFVSLGIGSLRSRGDELTADRVISFEGFETNPVPAYQGVVRVPAEWQVTVLDDPGTSQPTDWRYTDG
ncbi:MAG: ABC transporter ATP-binding protein [Actinobacteria bacterium]|jgi:lipopolysaccharide transport system ATP-binding protein|nr:ABC transporter ATP-binding protein [Actinomycetota bacterium]